MERTYEANRSLKRRLVEEDRAHAARVYDGSEVVAWCEYGSPEELPNIYHRKQYEEELDVLPAYRITCKSWTSDTGGRKKSVLYNGTRTLFEQAGFDFVRPKGAGNCVMRRTVP